MLRTQTRINNNTKSIKHKALNEQNGIPMMSSVYAGDNDLLK
jgi:hypothetical protein